MPRKARIDAPGAIHHIICRDIERREISRDDTDRDSFIERFERRYRLQMHGLDVDKVVDQVTEIFNLKPEEVLTCGKQPQRVKARSLLCYWVVKELGLSCAYMARRLKISKSAVSRAIVRGEKIATDMKLKLIDS
jgi:putative transposase